MAPDSRFRRAVGILLVAIGSVAGLAGAGGAIVFAAFWYYGLPFNPGDRRAWLACTVIGCAVGGPTLWAGVKLLRTRGTQAARGRSFRLRLTGPQRRRSASAAYRSTLVWMFVAAECCFVDGRPAARFRHALVGALATYLAHHATILLHELGAGNSCTPRASTPRGCAPSSSTRVCAGWNPAGTKAGANKPGPVCANSWTAIRAIRCSRPPRDIKGSRGDPPKDHAATSGTGCNVTAASAGRRQRPSADSTSAGP